MKGQVPSSVNVESLASNSEPFAEPRLASVSPSITER